MVDSFVTLTAALLWVVAAAQWRRARRPIAGKPSRWLAVALTASALTATSFMEASNRLLSSGTGITNLAEPVGRTSLLVAAWAGPLLVHSLAQPDRDVRVGRSRLLALLLGVIGLWTIFAAAPDSSALRTLDRSHPADGYVAAYTFVSVLMLAVALVEITVGTRQYAKGAVGPVAKGLRVVGAGCVLGLAYITLKVAVTLGALSGYAAAVAPVQATVGRTLAVLAGLAIAGGCLAPVLARSTSRTRRTMWAHRSTVRLYPLWRTAILAFPDVALFPAKSRLLDLMIVPGAEGRLYRRVIELRDARLALDAAPADTVGIAHTAFADAVHAAENRPPAGRGSAAADQELDGIQEVAWWLMVTECLGRPGHTFKPPAQRDHIATGSEVR